ncbi:MAG: S41 family peptidase [Actinobacteria bacterium]|nr:S41 family peptidase [Actinomycetota bacterium]
MRRRILGPVTAAILAVVLPVSTFVAGSRLNRVQADGFGQVAAAGNRLLERSALPLTLRELVDAAIKGMLEATGDPYAGLLAPEDQAELDQLIRGTIVGIGVWLQEESRGLRITSVIPDTPAERAGVKPGDLIVAVDGRALPKAGADRNRALRGEAGTRVTLTLLRRGTRLRLTMERARIPVPDVNTRMLKGRVGYARLHQFGEGAAEELRAAVQGLLDQDAVGIVLDLRDNPGGLRDEAFDAASAFIESGLIATIVERGKDPVRVEATGTALPDDFPLVVLVNGNSASASEILAGALHDRGRAMLVGTRTFGKGSVLAVESLEDGGPLIQYTTAFFIRPNGQEVEGRGIAPDVAVVQPGAGDVDVQLRRAVVLVLRQAGA